MKHFTTPEYWRYYHKLTSTDRNLADKHFNLLKTNHKHPSLRLKKIGKYWSVRAGLHVRALGVEAPGKDDIIWFWIGLHSDYERLIKK